jgi:glutamine---fructose-6-phosphate transaminase (isomerizing)
MCGIFGSISEYPVKVSDIKILGKLAQQRGKDSSGIIQFREGNYEVHRAEYSILSLLDKLKENNANVILGHSRLITNGYSDNQPIIKNNVFVLHNGIIVNSDELWNQTNIKREQSIDTEIIAAIAIDHINSGEAIDTLASQIFSKCKGVVSCAIALPDLGKLVLLSNNGSLYIGSKEKRIFFASEEYPLNVLVCDDIKQLLDDFIILEIPISKRVPFEKNYESSRLNLVPELVLSGTKEKLLEYKEHNIQRCTKCILPKTMPFIEFDQNGVCNYCRNYKLRNVPKDKSIIFNLLEKYRRKVGNECILPFSGGRDSCYGLHLVVKELKLKPLAYTYDWGMVTDLGRRNISRMCSILGIENIIVAADITQKRKNIYKNICAWLKSPHLGMVSIFTAGDKHFFRYIENIKLQTGISLNLWGVNPLEVTHFKAGFLGIPPDFKEKRVYSHGGMKQLRYQYLRFGAMLNSPSYFNSSMWDTISGEYYRSYHKKRDYYHIFDYWQWDEETIDNLLLNEYDWETAPDTSTTWRIGDGTAAFYNYIYYTVAGFTEHDTFRSNQIREGQITRKKALELVKEENLPRYPNLQWYLDTVGLDFKEVISVVNQIPKLY